MIFLCICPNGKWWFAKSVGVQYGHPKWPDIWPTNNTGVPEKSQMASWRK